MVIIHPFHRISEDARHCSALSYWQVADGDYRVPEVIDRHSYNHHVDGGWYLPTVPHLVYGTLKSQVREAQGLSKHKSENRKPTFDVEVRCRFGETTGYETSLSACLNIGSGHSGRLEKRLIFTTRIEIRCSPHPMFYVIITIASSFSTR